MEDKIKIFSSNVLVALGLTFLVVSAIWIVGSILWCGIYHSSLYSR